MRLRWWVAVCLVVGCVCAGRPVVAQSWSQLTASPPQPVISPDMPVNVEMLRQWVHSGDPRLIAWAADFARRNHEAAILEELSGLLVSRDEHGQMIPSELAYTGTRYDSPKRLAASAILDALIQEKVHVPVGTIDQIASVFPNQAIVLISRLPISESRSELRQWSIDQFGERMPFPTRTRVAAMILAKHPDKALVAMTLQHTEEVLTVHVSVGHVMTGQAGGTSNECGVVNVRLRPASGGWPASYDYALYENDSFADTFAVVDVDGDRINGKRVPMDSASCEPVYFVEPPSAMTSYRLVAHWLFMANSGIGWDPQESAHIEWKDEADYERRLGAIVESHRKPLLAGAKALERLGLIGEGDAELLAPRLVVRVECVLKQECPLQTDK